MCVKNNSKSKTPGTPGTKSYAQIVNNYQSLTDTIKTYIPGVTWHVDTLLNLTIIKKNKFDWKFACSRFVGGKF